MHALAAPSNPSRTSLTADTRTASPTRTNSVRTGSSRNGANTAAGAAPLCAAAAGCVRGKHLGTTGESGQGKNAETISAVSKKLHAKYKYNGQLHRLLQWVTVTMTSFRQAEVERRKGKFAEVSGRRRRGGTARPLRCS